VAQQLSILVEKGEVDTPAVEAAVAKIMRPLRNCDSILLACTHYPVLSKVIGTYHNGSLIDPVPELYRSIRKYLDKQTKGRSIFLTTGDPVTMAFAARRAFGIVIPAAKRVII
jgi:glutamate racemase